ncbi:mediator of RNA polymerase II transcription subunit 14-like isoform X5 [Camellia sinensis]|uniref:mediator of RNA polymerase II transcription subunit 14-like isoform X5 n=1 Tax=Camellia sinensis TaxID=4442 RepID=UPI001036BB31|nr:mediator of RNA polymerase II transcription subunit 14-like isoform X5 [Camellia sinensis]
MRRAFRIEAVGLMSLWFSFGSGVLACFVVEWESGKEGSTMHVSPDQLLPHTKLPDQRRSSPSPDSSRLRATPFEAQRTCCISESSVISTTH